MPVTVGRVATIRPATTEGGIGPSAPARTVRALKLVYEGTPNPSKRRPSSDNMDVATRARFKKHSVATAEPVGNSDSKSSCTRTRGRSPGSGGSVDIELTRRYLTHF